MLSFSAKQRIWYIQNVRMYIMTLQILIRQKKHLFSPVDLSQYNTTLFLEFTHLYINVWHINLRYHTDASNSYRLPLNTPVRTHHPCIYEAHGYLCIFYALCVNPPLFHSSFHSLGDSYVGTTPNTKNVSSEQQYLQHDEGWPLRTAESVAVIWEYWKHSVYRLAFVDGYSSLMGHYVKFWNASGSDTVA